MFPFHTLINFLISAFSSWSPGKNPTYTVHVYDVAAGLWACAEWIAKLGRKENVLALATALEPLADELLGVTIEVGRVPVRATARVELVQELRQREDIVNDWS